MAFFKPRNFLVAVLLCPAQYSFAADKVPLEQTQKLATQGDAQAQYDLGHRYEYGDELPMDGQKAVEWLLKAAAQGNVRAQERLGSWYSLGQYVEKNPQEAVKMFKKAAAQKSSYAYANLGYHYDEGEGVQQDTVLAYVCYSMSIELGSTDKTNAYVVKTMTEELTPKQLKESKEIIAQLKIGKPIPNTTKTGKQ